MTRQTSKSSSEPQLIFCMVTYNGAKTIRATLESIKDIADKIVVVEGRFAEFVNVYPTQHSTDETLNIAKEYPTEIIQHDGLTQTAARELYLVGEDGDYYILWDDDWILETTHTKESLKKRLSEVRNWAFWLHCPAESTPRGCPTEIAYETNGVLCCFIFQHPRQPTLTLELTREEFNALHLAKSLCEPYDYSNRTDFNEHTKELMRKAQRLAREQNMVKAE